jgi:hypothetical protein
MSLPELKRTAKSNAAAQNAAMKIAINMVPPDLSVHKRN